MSDSTKIFGTLLIEKSYFKGLIYFQLIPNKYFTLILIKNLAC
jgi:hypothetical protein